MDPVRDPYTPNAGAQPPAVLGRDVQLQTFDLFLRRMSAGRTEQSMVITGLRGVGKTVLLGKFQDRALEHNGVVIEREVSKHDDTAFHRQMAAGHPRPGRAAGAPPSQEVARVRRFPPDTGFSPEVDMGFPADWDTLDLWQ